MLGSLLQIPGSAVKSRDGTTITRIVGYYHSKQEPGA